jgi:hypothetical protein
MTDKNHMATVDGFSSLCRSFIYWNYSACFYYISSHKIPRLAMQKNILQLEIVLDWLKLKLRPFLGKVRSGKAN